MAAMSEQGIRVLMETDDNYTLPRTFGKTGDVDRPDSTR
jgi:hypothetical protein